LEQKNTGVTLAGCYLEVPGKRAFLVSGNPFDLRAGIHRLIIGRGFLKSKHTNPGIPSKGFSKYFWLGKYPPIHWNNRSCKCNHISKILRKKKQTKNSGVFFQACHGSFTWWRLSLTFGEELSNLTYLDHLLRLGLDRVETKVGWTSSWDLTFFWYVSRNPNAGYIGVEILPTYIGIIS